MIALAASLALGQRRGDIPPALVWDNLMGNCPAHLDWASLRGNVVVLSFGAGAFPEDIADWNETIQRFKGQPALFFQIAHDSEFLLDQALKRTAYSGCLLFDEHDANQRNFKLRRFPQTVVVDGFGYIAGYTADGPDEEAIQRLLNRQPETGLDEEQPKAGTFFEDAARDIPPSFDVHISPAAKDERRSIGYTPEPDLYITKNQPLKIIIVDLWDPPAARILLPENLDEITTSLPGYLRPTVN